MKGFGNKKKKIQKQNSRNNSNNANEPNVSNQLKVEADNNEVEETSVK